jgi:copper chaperone CopZ
MNKSIKIGIAFTVMLSFMVCNAQIKNAITESVKIYGNCGMCKTTIEKAGNIKKVAQVEWNKDSKMAILTYDPSKTNTNEILKRIALAGYDSDQFLAPDEVYAKLPNCCQYDRKKKSEIAASKTSEDHAMHHHDGKTESTGDDKPEVTELSAVFERYFALKDALVSSDGHLATAKAKELLHALKEVQMNKLTPEEHGIWMKVMKDLIKDAERIEATKELELQRDRFMKLSEKLYQLLKVSKQETPVYYQHCPMADNGKGAHWLSKENAVKNPYFGSKMLTCGKTVETIE